MSDEKCKVSLSIYGEAKEQVFLFLDSAHVQEFVKMLELQKSQMEERRKKNVEKALQYSKKQLNWTEDFPDSKVCKFLVEIVGAVGGGGEGEREGMSTVCVHTLSGYETNCVSVSVSVSVRGG